MLRSGKLAILGGEKTIPDDLIKPWPSIGDIDREYVLASLEGNEHAYGPNCIAFEEEFANWNENKYAITTNSGTAALHMGIAACGCEVGDEVIVPAYSWSSSATCVLHHNAIPVFVDIDWETMNIDPARIESKISEKTRAILVVHLHGLAANMETIGSIARKYSLKVIEDACQAHGAEFQGKKVGGWGDCAVFSFNQNKCVSAGEGGMFVTDSKELLKKAKMLWSFGEIKGPGEERDYHVHSLGWMYRNNDLSAAFGRAQLTHLDTFLATQRKNALVLRKELENLSGLMIPRVPEGCKHNWYNFVCRVDAGACGYQGDRRRFRDAVVKAIEAEGVRARAWQKFILPAMGVFQTRSAYGHGFPWSWPGARKVSYDPADYPVAQKHCDTHFVISVPLRAPHGEEVATLVGGAIRKVFDNLNELDIDQLTKEESRIGITSRIS